MEKNTTVTDKKKFRLTEYKLPHKNEPLCPNSFQIGISQT